MNEKISISIFRLLFTLLSLAIILPSMWESDYRILTLSFAVFSLSKIVDSVESIILKRNVFFFLYAIECFIAIVAVALCFFYLAACINLSVAEINIDMLNKYPIIGTSLYPKILFFVTTAYFITDLFDCFSIIYKFYHTKTLVLNMIKNY